MNAATQKIDDAFLRHYDMIVRAAQRHAPNADLAGDVVQQTYLEFSQGVREERWNLEEDLKPLLYRIAQLIALRCWRERQKSSLENNRKIWEFIRRRYEQEFQGQPEPDTSDEIRHLKTCMRKISDRERELIEKRYFLGMSNARIAADLNFPLKSVQQLLRRGREKIRNCIQRQARQEKESPTR